MAPRSVAQLRAAQIRLVEIGAGEVGAGEARAGKPGVVKIRLPEIGAGEISTGKVAPLEIHAAKVAARAVVRATVEKVLAWIGLRGGDRRTGSQNQTGCETTAEPSDQCFSGYLLMKPSRLGIFTLGKVCASITSISPMTLFRGEDIGHQRVHPCTARARAQREVHAPAHDRAEEFTGSIARA